MGSKQKSLELSFVLEDASLEHRVVLEHGPITNVLAALDLIDQVRIAIMCKRTYKITVVQNTLAVQIPIDRLCDFPGLVIPSDAFEIKKVKATIDGYPGEFFGIVRRETNLPDGYGVFKEYNHPNDPDPYWLWAHCGQVKDGKFLEGKMVSANKLYATLKLRNKKWLPDGSVLEKTEIFSRKGVER